MSENAVKAGNPAVVKKTIPSETISSYLELLREAKVNGKIASFDYNRPTDFGSILNGALLILMMISLGAFVFISYSRRDSDGRTRCV